MLSIVLAIFLAFLAGIIAGVITGLLPGLHINLIASSVVVFSTVLLPIFSQIPLVVFIASMTISNIFIAFIPSIFLGAPDEDNFLSVLPGHELLLKGKGHEAVMLISVGGIIGIFLFLLVSPLLLWIIPPIYSYLKFVILNIFKIKQLIINVNKIKFTA